MLTDRRSRTMATAADRRRKRPRGQIIVVFAGAMIVFVALCAVVVDVSWFWANSLRAQRAVDAAALAGVVNLPGDEAGAIVKAKAEAAKNGFIDAAVNPATANATITAWQDPTNARRLRVTMNTTVGTFFARAIGINSFPIGVQAKADYTLPVPMGSPENYYGVFGLTRNLTSTTTTTNVIPVNTPSSTTSTALGHTTATLPAAVNSGNPANSWSANSGNIPPALAGNEADTSPNWRFASSTTNNATLDLYGFNLTGGLAANQSVTGITGLQITLSDAYVSATCATTYIGVQVSYDAGSHWSTTSSSTQTAALTTSTKDKTFGSAANMTLWTFSSPTHTWDTNDFDNANFRVRLTALKGCATAGTQVKLDNLTVNAVFTINTATTTTTTTTTTSPIADQNLKGPGTACAGAVANCYVADGATLNPRGFWGTMNSEGAGNINGDAYQPYYDSPTSQTAPACSTAASGRACYDATNYYNYAVELPAGATGGAVYVYDPVFCSVSVGSGTGDRWFGNSNPVSSFYELYDTQNTLYDQSDDTLVQSSGGLFRQIKASDTTMGGTNSGSPAQCRHNTDSTYGDGRDYHDNWYLLASGLTGNATGPRTYRLHTTSTDPSNVNDQKNTNAENSFALYASASGGTPKLYGLGAMQAFTPLTAGSGGSSTTVTSTFYLAQIDAVHAGKTVEISLWDPGDTDPLTASIEILMPTSGGWTPASLTYSATLGTNAGGRADGSGGAPDCRTLSRTTPSTSGITTYDNASSSNTGNFNGCWLTIDAVIPSSYTAPQSGWWQIRYTMTGNGTSNDVTTWTAAIRGNPVHLVLP